MIRLCIAAVLCAAATTSALAVECRTITDRDKRLDCYDAAFGIPPPTATAQPRTRLQEFWEQNTGEPLLRLRTLRPNYVLLHHTDDLNTEPTSPTRGDAPPLEGYRKQELKLQVSLRGKLLDFGNAGNVWAAYTQQSLWQAANDDVSSPFRSTDHQPGLLYAVQPSALRLPTEFGGWTWSLLTAGIAHQSNGQSEPMSRSWNRTTFGTAVERGNFGIQLRHHQRWNEDAGDDDNPDLLSYIGSNEVELSWTSGRIDAGLTWRGGLHAPHRGSVQFDLHGPLLGDKGPRWYVQLFSGYGETLLDYNHKQDSVGVGLILFEL